MPRAALLILSWFAVQSTAHPCGTEALPQDVVVPETDSELRDAYELALENSASRELLERAQQLWEEYRRANCELMSARDAGASQEASVQCHAFMARERNLELRLLSY